MRLPDNAVTIAEVVLLLASLLGAVGYTTAVARARSAGRAPSASVSRHSA